MDPIVGVAIAAVAAGAAAVTAGADVAALASSKRTIASSNNVDVVYGVLDVAMKMLVARRDDRKYEVQRSKTTMMPSNTYTNWLDQVNKVEIKVEAIRILYMNRGKRLLPSFFPYDITKQMKQIANDIFVLMESDIGALTHKKPPARVVEIITPRINDIPTLQQPLEQILVWLREEKVTGIRIQGTVGIGKTTIMQNLNNHVKVGEMFDIVIWVTVSREGSMENKGIDQIQQVIAQRLKLDDVMTPHLDQVASTIKEELKAIKYLLLLDDVRENLDLEEIGVPMNNNGSKIVFTTRSQHVCFKIASRHTIIKKLNKKEALEMFKSVLNHPDHEKKYYIKRLMSQIVEWCGYHPLMIKVAAGVFSMKVMKDDDAKTEQSWNDGLTNLNNWPEEDGEMQHFYNSLKCCFDCLEVTKKKCFFYSALYPEDSDIQKACLLNNWAAEKLLGANDDVENMHAIGRGVLEYLNMASLIEETTSQHCIKIHKLIRQAALYNSAKEDQGFLVKSGKALQNPLDAKCWKEKRWISLVDSKMKALPDKPVCSKLSTLFLQKNPSLEAIPQDFFTHMQTLYVLDLYDTRITSLPSSLLELTSLKVLYLQNCVALVELPSDIKNLQKLEVLDIRGSGIVNIPTQVETLIRLRRLLVSFTISPSQTPIQEAVNASNIISKLLCLKELVIDVEESLEEILYDAIVNVVKLTTLSLLQFCSSNKVIDLVTAMGEDLKIHFPNEKLLQSCINKVNSFELKGCQFFTGCDISSQPHIVKFKPYYKFDGEVSNNTISQVLCNDVAIELVNHNELEHLSTLTAANMNRIRSCVIKGCNKMRTMVDANVGGSSILDNLKQLHMINLPILKSICEGPMHGLKSLKTLMLCDCPMLTTICAYGVILQLPEIRHLEVRGCSEIKEIFSGSPNIVLPILPNLKKLVLVDMPQLTSILANDSFNWPSLEKLKILKCPELKRLPFRKHTAVKLRSIEAEKSWWEALENDQVVKEEFAGCNFTLI